MTIEKSEAGQPPEAGEQGRGEGFPAPPWRFPQGAGWFEASGCLCASGVSHAPRHQQRDVVELRGAADEGVDGRHDPVDHLLGRLTRRLA